MLVVSGTQCASTHVRGPQSLSGPVGSLRNIRKCAALFKRQLHRASIHTTVSDDGVSAVTGALLEWSGGVWAALAPKKKDTSSGEP